MGNNKFIFPFEKLDRNLNGLINSLRGKKRNENL